RYKITSLYATLANFTVTVIPIGIICIIATFLGLRKLYRQDFDYKNKLRYEACHDQLTGLPNRYYATEFFDEWRQSFANKISALFIDLDNFKFINDHFGHNTGDIVLQQIVTRLKQFERTDNALLIRHGGDEFVCLIPLTGKQRIIETSKRVLEQIKLPIHCNDLRFSITASIGISIYDHISDGLETLLSKSDTAMLEAKKLKNHFSFYSDRLKKRNERNAEIKSEISSAIENNEFYVVYQAQVDAKTERLRGFETLMRWHSDKLGNVPPNEFIPILESSGQIVQLSEMMIRLVFEEFEQISKTPGLSVSINVSVHQLIYGNFRGFLNREVSRFSISPEQIILEVTESLFIEDINQVGRTLQNLKEDGFLISLDDFGTGYSSLGSIRALPFSELKVDRSFVSGILEDPSDEILVKQIIDIGHNQNTHVVAEGVESKEQVYLLRELGCDLLQGFYFSKPISIKEVKEHYCHELHVA
ncbi:MAG: bifunctional diguanylate cyclase/phosphodiesterase, partial [Pseudomonadota bacterium]